MQKGRRLGAEFVTIVVGVLVALGVDSWYGGIEERRLGSEYESRLAAELETARTFLGDLSLTNHRAFEAGVSASVAFDRPGESIDPATLVGLVYTMGRDQSDTFDLTTFEDLVSSGQLGLISGLDRRRLVQRAYSMLAGLDTQPYRQEFLGSVRGWLPLHLLGPIRDSCSFPAPAGPCTFADLDPDDVAAILPHLSTDEAKLGFRLRMQALETARQGLEQTVVAVDSALAVLTDNPPAGSI